MADVYVVQVSCVEYGEGGFSAGGVAVANVPVAVSLIVASGL
jgi:hypothetical protein